MSNNFKYPTKTDDPVLNAEESLSVILGVIFFILAAIPCGLIIVSGLLKLFFGV